jgi:hypothetical protein
VAIALAIPGNVLDLSLLLSSASLYHLSAVVENFLTFPSLQVNFVNFGSTQVHPSLNKSDSLL